MSKEEATGGPAFPRPHSIPQGDMTLRDYFAAMYLAVYIANPDMEFQAQGRAAEAAYRMADAMLEARKG